MQWKAKNYLYTRANALLLEGSQDLQKPWISHVAMPPLNIRRHTAKMQAETSAKRLKDRLQTKRPMSYIC